VRTLRGEERREYAGCKRRQMRLTHSGIHPMPKLRHG
jgi:hypothetical protein